MARNLSNAAASLLPYSTIEAAASGNVDAINLRLGADTCCRTNLTRNCLTTITLCAFFGMWTIGLLRSGPVKIWTC